MLCLLIVRHMSLRMRKSTICICENKDADQLCSNCKADQCLCFRHTDSKIPLILKSKVSSFSLYSVTVQPWFVSDLVGNPNCWFSRAQESKFLSVRSFVRSSVRPSVRQHLRRSLVFSTSEIAASLKPCIVIVPDIPFKHAP